MNSATSSPRIEITWRRRARPTRRERVAATVLGLGLAAWCLGLFVLVLLAQPGNLPGVPFGR